MPPEFPLCKDPHAANLQATVATLRSDCDKKGDIAHAAEAEARRHVKAEMLKFAIDKFRLLLNSLLCFAMSRNSARDNIAVSAATAEEIA